MLNEILDITLKLPLGVGVGVSLVVGGTIVVLVVSSRNSKIHINSLQTRSASIINHQRNYSK